MNRFITYLIVVPVALALAIGFVVIAANERDKDTPDVDSAVGKCIQAQRVLYHVERGEAAEKCLANLDRSGEKKFARTWANYETEEGSW